MMDSAGKVRVDNTYKALRSRDDEPLLVLKH